MMLRERELWLLAEEVFSRRNSLSGFAWQDGSGMDANYKKAKTVPRAEIVNSSARLSAFEDFMKRTMMAFQGSWARLDYMRHLRGESGTYEHWGLERTYGANASQRVMGDVHAEIATQVLQTPIRELLEQLEVSADDLGITPAALGKRLRDKERAVAPQDLRGRSPKHRAAVLLAIQLLTQAASAAGVQEPTSTK